ncbi:hypothetical protein C8F01DRAFT_1119072 [Mycena amicta]|nr:hypothetical protein C8F01DRAFT_1119072 [Mycena amicta]
MLHHATSKPEPACDEICLVPASRPAQILQQRSSIRLPGYNDIRTSSSPRQAPVERLRVVSAPARLGLAPRPQSTTPSLQVVTPSIHCTPSIIDSPADYITRSRSRENLKIEQSIDTLERAIGRNARELAASHTLEDFLNIRQAQRKLHEELSQLKRLRGRHHDLELDHVERLRLTLNSEAYRSNNRCPTILKDEFFARLAEVPLLQYLETTCYARTRQPLTLILRSIFDAFEAGDPFAVQEVLKEENQADQVRLKDLLVKHNVPLGPRQDLSRADTCDEGVAAIFRMLIKWEELESGVPIPMNKIADKINRLVPSFEQVVHLVRTERVLQPRSPIRRRLRRLFAEISNFSVTRMHEILKITGAIEAKYATFWDAILRCEDGNIDDAIRELRACVRAEVQRVEQVATEFGVVRDRYDAVRSDLGLELEAAADEARRSSLAEGVIADEKVESVHNQLSELDERFAAVEQGLRERKAALNDFLEVLDRLPSNAPEIKTPDTPPITDGQLDRTAARLVEGLGDVSSAVHAARAPKKLATLGGNLTNEAHKLHKKCQDVIPRLASSIEKSTTLRTVSLYHSMRQRLSFKSLGMAVDALASGYQKLWKHFESYKDAVYLLLWYGGSTAAEKRADERMATDTVQASWIHSHNLSPYLRPFEFAFSDLKKGLDDYRAALIVYSQ